MAVAEKSITKLQALLPAQGRGNQDPSYPFPGGLRLSIEQPPGGHHLSQIKVASSGGRDDAGGGHARRQIRPRQGANLPHGYSGLVRLPMMQRQRDVAAGLNTACFISGYRGSPLGGLDQALWG